MPFPVLILSLAAVAAQPAAPVAMASIPQANLHRRRLFVSPMGEPFTGGRSGDALAEWFQQADRNHDGVISREEMTQDAERFFASLDVNHDGEIDPDEINRYETAIAPQNRRALGLLQLSEPVSSADSNFNRGVSLQEFRTAAERRFVALDLDHQGKLTLAALEAIKPPPPEGGKRDPDAPKQIDAEADTGGGG
jgi:Ca2+-binding EF-hand superfamily protein